MDGYDFVGICMDLYGIARICMETRVLYGLL